MVNLNCLSIFIHDKSYRIRRNMSIESIFIDEDAIEELVQPQSEEDEDMEVSVVEGETNTSQLLRETADSTGAMRSGQNRASAIWVTTQDSQNGKKRTKTNSKRPREGREKFFLVE